MIGSLFSGIGGFELGLEAAGLGPVAWQVEKDPYARAVLARHWPDVPRYNDVRDVGAHNLGAVDIMCGGFPCQDVSSAGRRAGLQGEKSGLWYEYLRIVQELLPPVVLVENVASGEKRWLPHVTADLEASGYVVRAYHISAADVGAPQLRRRVFVVGYGESSSAISFQRPRPRPHAFPPRRGDDAAWEEWTARGGPSPGQRREAPQRRPPRGQIVATRANRLRALGNSVVPQCAEQIGHLVLAYFEQSVSLP